MAVFSMVQLLVIRGAMEQKNICSVARKMILIYEEKNASSF